MSPRWSVVPTGEEPSWDARLLGYDADVAQFPFWNRGLVRPGVRATSLVCRDAGREVAFAGLLTFGVGPLKLGLICDGPVDLVGAGVSPAQIESLRRWARWRGHAFVRFSHEDPAVLAAVEASGPCERGESFELYRARREEAIVHQTPTDAPVLVGFSQTCRYRIKRAIQAGYEITWSNSPAALEAVWPLFLANAARKNYRYASPVGRFLGLLARGAAHDLARVYVASHSGRPVASILVVRGGRASRYVIGALDRERIVGESPAHLIHWRAMRDLSAVGVTEYGLGSRSGTVWGFKRKFHPELRLLPPPVSAILAPARFRALKRLERGLAEALLPAARRARSWVEEWMR